MVRNDWKLLWNKRIVNSEQLNSVDDKEMFLELKRAAGFDISSEMNYDSFMQQLKTIDLELMSCCQSMGRDIGSLFEIGCGSGANLWYYFKKGFRVGGVDYSQPLLDCAKKIVPSDELFCDEAININSDVKYDAILSNSVFSYFQDYKYAETVLEKMYDKVNSLLILIDIHDGKKMEQFVDFRKKIVDDYENKYKYYPKLFYDTDFFMEFADKHGMDIKFSKSRVNGYWNNDYVFNCYLYKI